MRKLWAIEVYDQGWKIKAVTTNPEVARVAWDNVTKGNRARLNEYTYDTLSFLWTEARDCVTVEKKNEAGALS